jgi:protein phosphatase
MGTTLLAAWHIPPTTLWIGHVGDCRAYRLRAGRLRQLSEDHTVFNQVRKSRRVTGEILDPALRHQLSQALGSSEFIAPQILKLKIEPGDRYLLCTDGLPDMLPDAEIEAVLHEGLDAGQICRELVAAANLRGGKDNITVIIMDCAQEMRIRNGGSYASD